MSILLKKVVNILLEVAMRNYTIKEVLKKENRLKDKYQMISLKPLILNLTSIKVDLYWNDMMFEEY